MPIRIFKHCRLNPEPTDGTRLLVMRYWPRGCNRDQFDVWLPDLAPSKELLAWVKGQQQYQEHDPMRVNEIWRDRYIGEMEAQSGLIAELRGRHEDGEVMTLLCSCHRPEECHRSILKNLILGSKGQP